MPAPTPPNTTKNSLQVRMLGIAGQGHDGQVLLVDEVTARSMPAYFRVGFSGTTAQRPDGSIPDSEIAVNTAYYDTTLSALVLWDGKNWRSPATGGIV